MVSVIVPIYNVEKYLARCLESILKQTYSDVEIICVDDCGSDRSMEVADYYQELYVNKIKVICSEENVGLGGARDKGIRHASGDYIMFVDSDDYIADKEYINAFVQCAKEKDADIVMGGYTREVQRKRTRFPGKCEDPYYKWFFVSACAKLYNRKFINENTIDFRGVRTYEDAPFWYRCLAASPRCEVLADAGYIYCMNPSSITGQKNTDRTELFVRYLETIQKCGEEVRFPVEELEVFRYCLLSAATVMLLYNGRGCGKARMLELYEQYDSYIRELTDRPEKNGMIRLLSRRAEPAKNRLATYLVMMARRIRLDKIIYILVSRI